jgi:hypothetical protein
LPKNLDRYIFVQLSGGIGNQLFMYVAGLSLSLRKNAALYCCRKPNDKAEFLHPGCLNDFHLRFIEKNFTTLSRINHLSSKFQGYLIRVIPSSFDFLFRKLRFYMSLDLGYDARVWKLNPPVNLQGYFQSYRYFDYCRKFLSVNEIVSLKSPSQEFLRLEKSISVEDFCAIHVRRGDYLQHKDSLGILDVIYYRNAFKKISGLKSGLRFLVFSDDPLLAKELLVDLLPSNTLWPNELNDLSAAENLILMSKAKALIIANSTFSLFAALLADQNAIVIRPDFWSIDVPNPIDLFRPSWHKVSRSELT